MVHVRPTVLEVRKGMGALLGSWISRAVRIPPPKAARAPTCPAVRGITATVTVIVRCVLVKETSTDMIGKHSAAAGPHCSCQLHTTVFYGGQ